MSEAVVKPAVVVPVPRGNLLVDTWWVCWRELKHYVGQPMRIFMTLFQPLVWLVLMGNMYQRIAAVPGFPAKSYLDYMAPGIVVMVTLFGGMFTGMSVVWDRRLGFLHKMLAAPLARSAVVTGKMLAAGIQAIIQGLVILLIALAMGVKFSAGIGGVPLLLLLAALLCLVLTGFSLALAAVVTTHETLMALVNFFTMPLMFTSNAMMPTQFMPTWLADIARVNPISFAINPMRTLFLSGYDVAGLVEGFLILGALVAVMAFIASSLFRRGMA
jgi:ABC-2 type transport system permease protein